MLLPEYPWLLAHTDSIGKMVFNLSTGNRRPPIPGRIRAVPPLQCDSERDTLLPQETANVLHGGLHPKKRSDDRCTGKCIEDQHVQADLIETTALFKEIPLSAGVARY